MKRTSCSARRNVWVRSTDFTVLGDSVGPGRLASHASRRRGGGVMRSGLAVTENLLDRVLDRHIRALLAFPVSLFDSPE